MCTAKGSDVRPGVPWGSAAFFFFFFFCVAGMGQHALPRGPMYALASLGAPSLLRGRRGTMCTAKGSDVRPGVPWGSAAFAWQAWDNVHCQGVRCTPWRPLGLRRFCLAGVGQCALPRGRMYALASLGAPSLLRGRRGTMCTAKGSDVRPGVPWGSASFAWQAWDNMHCQGVRCTLLRGRRGTMCTAKGPDVRPGVPWGSAAFAWKAWDNVHCQGVRCTPWRPLGLRRFCVAGVGQCALPRGPMYALASLGAPPLLRGRRGTTCTAKGSDVRPGVPWGSDAFAWQAWDNLHCQGVRCTPWRPLGLRRFCVAGVGQCALPRGPMYALASLGAPSLLRGRRGTMCMALPRGRMYALASLGAPPLLRGRRGTTCTAKGSDVRPGVPWGSAAFASQAWDNVHCQGVRCTPWRPLGLRRFCAAGVGQCALPRGPMYALASLGAQFLLRGRRGSHSLTHSFTHSRTHSLTHSLTHALTHSLTQSLYSLTHSPTHSLTYSIPLLTPSLTPSLTHSLYLNIHTHTHKLTYLPTYIPTYIPPSSLHHSHTSSSLLAFSAQSKSKEVGNMWGYPVL